jgi:hypothetical protein
MPRSAAIASSAASTAGPVGADRYLDALGCRAAPLRSVAVRYFPARNPLARAQYGSTPRPNSATTGAHSSS